MVRPNAIASKTTLVLAASILVAATALPAILLGRANAAQVTSRKITMTNSAVSATDVTYDVDFVAPTGSSDIGGVVVDFCANSPLIGVACTAPTGFDLDAANLAISGLTGLTGFTKHANTDANTVILTNGTPENVANNVNISFELGNSATPTNVSVQNPSTLGTFYARIITYDTQANAAAYDDTQVNPTGGIDWGGVALSTTNNLTVTARVQETLTFCVYTNAAANCSGAANSSIDIPNSTTPLSPNSVSTNSDARFSLASNALSGVQVRMWSNNGSEGVLKSGTYTISAFGPTVDDVCTADSATTSVEQFGMRLSTVGSGQTAAAPYNCAASNHGWDADSAAGAGANDTTTVGSTYGDTIATTGGATDESFSTMEFAAKSALTTEAGIYQSVLNFIATGTY